MTWQEFESWLDGGHWRRRPLVMGVLNVTPDSFSDGGRFADVETAVERGREMAGQGAEMIDIGGESTRPGAARAAAEEQVRRIVPVIERLRDEPVVLSVDTTRAGVAEAALEAGAHVINDISGGLEDAEMLPLAARRRVPITLMHMRGQPATMQTLAQYRDVVAQVKRHLAERREAAIAAGVEAKRVILDPGIGFAKGIEHNLALLRHIGELAADLGGPLLVGTSRKSFIATITGEEEPSARVFGSVASACWCLTNGAAIVRVHDVAPTAKARRMIQAIREGFSA
jgi:dihydropteroate synthase